eukprot:746042-Hanusia_phi.AAC.2
MDGYAMVRRDLEEGGDDAAGGMGKGKRARDFKLWKDVQLFCPKTFLRLRPEASWLPLGNADRTAYHIHISAQIFKSAKSSPEVAEVSGAARKARRTRAETPASLVPS